ncbi:hypothetical protein C7H84_20150 [Burkholderia sp. Nafp2/4-1b]|nr:hypothetical protein C7H84_20150 [Burkholderia sp. Nafp2/4-1b]
MQRNAARGHGIRSHAQRRASFPFCADVLPPRGRPARRACVFATSSCKFNASPGGRRARTAASCAGSRFAVSGRADWYNRGLAAVAPHQGAASGLSVSFGPAMMHAPVVPEHSSIEENT